MSDFQAKNATVKLIKKFLDEFAELLMNLSNKFL